MMAQRRTLAFLAFSLLLVSACSTPLRQPVVIGGVAPTGERLLRVLDLELGERVHWRLADGRAGEGILVTATPDTLVLASRRVDLETPAPGISAFPSPNWSS